MIKKIAIDLLKDNDIVAEKFGSIYIGEDNFLMQAKINEKTYYFKFFINKNIKFIKSEVIFVNYLITQKISIPNFFKKNNNNIFYSKNKQYSITFYGTENIEGDKKPDINSDILRDIVKKIADLHIATKKFNKKSISIEKKTDYEKLIAFYILQNKFCKQMNLCKYFEKIFNCKPDIEETYPIHSDLYFNNIILKDNKFKSFIDFSDIRESFLEDDFGKFFQNLLCSKNFKFELIDELINIYESYSLIKLSKKNIYISIIYRSIYREYNRLLTSKEKIFNYRTKEILNTLINKL